MKRCFDIRLWGFFECSDEELANAKALINECAELLKGDHNNRAFQCGNRIPRIKFHETEISPMEEENGPTQI